MNPQALSASSPQANAATAASATQWGGITQGAGQLFSGITGFAASRYQAQVAKINEAIAKQNEERALLKGESDAMHYGLQASQRMGNIKAAQGSSGLDVGSGSAVDVQKSQSAIAQLDMRQIRENAAHQAYDYAVQASGFANQAELDKRSGINSLFAGGIGALSSFVSSSQSVASKWYQGSQAGLTPKGMAGPATLAPTETFGAPGTDSYNSITSWDR